MAIEREILELARAEGAGAALWRAASLWQRRLREALEALNLKPLEYLMLDGLATLAAGEAVKQAELARHCGIDVMTTSQTVRALEARKLVRRAPHPDDNRALAVRLAQPGRQLLQRARPVVFAAEEAFFGVLGADADAFTGALRLLSGEKPRRRVAAGQR